jgi:hypothetical protein
LLSVLPVSALARPHAHILSHAVNRVSSSMRRR